MAEVEPPQLEKGLAEAVVGADWAKSMTLYIPNQVRLYTPDGKQKIMVNAPDELINALEIAAAYPDKLKVFFWWDDNDAIDSVAFIGSLGS